jgi:predicted DNA-binding transcriptional regulator YafY
VDQAAYILSQPLHHSQKTILQNDQEVQIQLKVYITQELKMAILSYGKEVKVLQPKSLRTELKKVIETMVANYS